MGARVLGFGGGATCAFLVYGGWATDPLERRSVGISRRFCSCALFARRSTVESVGAKRPSGRASRDGDVGVYLPARQQDLHHANKPQSLLPTHCNGIPHTQRRRCDLLSRRNCRSLFRPAPRPLPARWRNHHPHRHRKHPYRDRQRLSPRPYAVSGQKWEGILLSTLNSGLLPRL